MSAKDDLRIFLNIMAQSDSGLNDPMLIAKFSKAKAVLHGIDSMQDSNAIDASQTVTPTQAAAEANQPDTTGQEALGEGGLTDNNTMNNTNGAV